MCLPCGRPYFPLKYKFTEQDQNRLHIVFNDLPYKTGLQTGCGFGCQIEGTGKFILFDMDANGEILVSKLRVA